MATMLITHDLALAAERSARIAVMHAGHIVEVGATAEILRQPREPYTRSLVAATPRADEDAAPRAGATPGAFGPKPLLAVEGLCRDYRLRSAGGMVTRAWARLSRPGEARRIDTIRAVDNVTFRLSAGESVGLVGESGSGKSTLAALIVRLIHSSYRGVHPVSRHRYRRHSGAAGRSRPLPPRHPDGVSGPLRQSQSAANRLRRHRRTDPQARPSSA